MENNWIKLKRGQNIDLPYDTIIEVMRKNGKVCRAKVNGNWLVYAPKDFDADDILSPVTQYRIIK